MDNSIKNQLEVLVGKSVRLNSNTYLIKNYKEVAGNICIITDSRTFQFYPNEIQENFLDLLDDPDKESIQKPLTLPSVSQENVTIKSTLLATMLKLKEDPTYIAQAKGICEVVNTMVNVQKTEMEMIKLHNDL
jgi:hypothetical protein